MSWPPGSALAVERAAAARLVLVLGDTDTGKTSLVSHLAAGLAARGHAVGVIDADLGQSQVGPPMALGLGRVTGPIAALGDAALLALSWVGGTSPPGLEAALWAGACRLADRGAALGLRPILVDTGGLVLGPVGRRVALGTARSLRPDLVICLQRADECEGVLAALGDGHAAPADGGRPDVLRLPASPAARRRSAEERREYRERALERYLDGSGTLELPGSALARAGAPGPANDAMDLEGLLVGLVGDDGETLGIGRIVGVDAARDRVVVETPWRGAVAGALIGRERFRPASAAR